MVWLQLASAVFVGTFLGTFCAFACIVGVANWAAGKDGRR